MTWINTFSGARIDPTNPRVEDIRIKDIAHHLSVINRFTGATREPYSVAEHCYRMSTLCPPELALECLMHDASEAYLNDISRPVKVKLPEYLRFEAQMTAAVRERFGLPGDHTPDAVKEWDNRMLVWEARDLGLTIEEEYDDITAPAVILRPWHWRDVRSFFLRRFEDLTRD